MSLIKIPCENLLSTVTKLNELKLIIGRDCKLEGRTIVVTLDAIDKVLEDYLNEQEVEEIPQRETVRTDRVIHMTDAVRLELLAVEASFVRDWNAAEAERVLEQIAIDDRRIAKQQLRSRILLPHVLNDIDPASTIVYGDGIEVCPCLEVPDGKERSVEKLIHYAHPCSPEELKLRESRIIANEIIRYRVPGLDDAEWMRQNEPIVQLNWRELVKERIKNGVGTPRIR